MTGYQIINSNAKENKSIFDYKKKRLLESIRELNKLELEIAELEAIK